jgi:hypothetical protein
MTERCEKLSKDLTQAQLQGAQILTDAWKAKRK